MNNYQVDYSWEDKVTSLVNKIILKLYRTHNPNKVLDLEKLVKKHLEQNE